MWKEKINVLDLWAGIMIANDFSGLFGTEIRARENYQLCFEKFAHAFCGKRHFIPSLAGEAPIGVGLAGLRVFSYSVSQNIEPHDDSSLNTNNRGPGIDLYQSPKALSLARRVIPAV